MDKQQFRWLKDSGEDRQGRRLEKNGIYDAGNYPAEVVAEWVRTGAVEIIQSGKKSRKEGE